MKLTAKEQETQTDPKIQRLIRTSVNLQAILQPYIITKKKQLTGDALDAAARKVTSYAALQSERAKWQSTLDKLEHKDPKYFHHFNLYVSKTSVDAYYGDMGGICLSNHPQAITNGGFYIQRLADQTDKEIVGMSIMYLSQDGFGSPKPAKKFWQAFAFNPLHSFLQHCNEEQQLYLYLQYRLNMEKLAWSLKIPVVISGIDAGWGLISNDSSFGNILHNYELSKATAKRVTAKGIAIYYDEKRYANALLIIDPRGYENTADISSIPTFYAHRELKAFAAWNDN